MGSSTEAAYFGEKKRHTFVCQVPARLPSPVQSNSQVSPFKTGHPILHPSFVVVPPYSSVTAAI
jgi:hypothetical protein